MQIDLNQGKKQLIKAIGISFIMVVVLVYISFRITKYYSETYFHKITEQKSLSELDIYHDGVRKTAQEKIEDKLSYIETTAKTSCIYSALEKNNIKELNNHLDQVIALKSSFDMILILDKKGNLITIRGVLKENEEKIKYGNYANRDYFQNVIKNKRTYIGEIGGYWAITISTPIFDTNGEIKYIMVGSDKLENLVNDFNFKTRFSNLSSILVDHEGNIVVKNDTPIKEKINILGRDQFVKKFIGKDDERFSFGINYENKKSYVRGSKINLNNNNKFYLFSYLPYEEKIALKDLQKGIKQLYLLIFIAALITFIAGWSMPVFIAKDFAKKISENMKKIIPLIIGFVFLFSIVGSVLAVEKNYRAIVVDKNLNIMKIINYTKENVQPRVFLENEFGIELPYTESIERHYKSMQSSLNLNKKGVIYDSNKGTILNLFSRLFYVILRSLGGQ